MFLFKDSFFENFAKSGRYWTVYSVKFQAPGVELTNHNLEVELKPDRSAVDFLAIFPIFYEKQFLRSNFDKMLQYLLMSLMSIYSLVCH